MPKRISKTLPADESEAAFLLVQRSLEKLDENPTPEKPPVPRAISRFMSKMGSKGGKIGGKRRLETMTTAQRKKVAQKAAEARWGKRK